jgi:hypothetical protein
VGAPPLPTVAPPAPPNRPPSPAPPLLLAIPDVPPLIEVAPALDAPAVPAAPALEPSFALACKKHSPQLCFALRRPARFCSTKVTVPALALTVSITAMCPVLASEPHTPP